MIEQIQMGHLKRRALKACGIHGIAVVLRGHFNPARRQILHRMIAAAMAELELVRFGAIGEGDHLVAQTDAEHRISAAQTADQLDDRGDVLRITRTVGKEHAVRIHEDDFLSGGRRRNDGDVAAVPVQAPDDAKLDAAVHGHDAEAVVRGAGIPSLFAGDTKNRVVRNGGVGNTRDGLVCRRGDVGDDSPACAKVPDAAGEHPGIDSVQAGDVILFKQLTKRAGIAEVGRHVVVIANDQTAD